MGLLLACLIGTLAVSFLCSVLEASLMSVPMSYVTVREEEGFKPAVLMSKYKKNPSRPLAAILSMNTIANTLGAAGIGRQATLVFGSEIFAVISIVTTVLILIVSEIIPKTIGTTHCKSLLGFTAVTVRILVVILYPVVICVEFIQKKITPATTDVSVSREEVGAVADIAEESGELDEDENEVIQNLIGLDEKTVADVMTPRVVCEIASENMTVKNFCRDRRFLHHSRIPVYSGNDEYLTGYVLRMDALQLMAEDKFDSRIKEIRRDIATVNEDALLSDVWTTMLERKEQIVVVINEYGSFQGILTLEDVIETILGDEIVDEHDAVEDMQQLARDKWKRRGK